MKTPLIIERPELQSPARRTLYSVVTALAWSIWLYLWLPLISLLAWMAGVQLLVLEVFLPVGGQDWMELLRLLVFVVVAILAVSVWSQYNLRRYGQRNRRKRIPDVDAQTLAKYYEISPELLEKLRHKRLITLDYSNDHHPVVIDTD